MNKMHFVFEIVPKEAWNIIPHYRNIGPIHRIRFLCFSFAYVSMSYSKFLNRLVADSAKAGKEGTI